MLSWLYLLFRRSLTIIYNIDGLILISLSLAKNKLIFGGFRFNVANGLAAPKNLYLNWILWSQLLYYVGIAKADERAIYCLVFSL